MKFRLQGFFHRDTDYDRANQNWQCGRLKNGKPCRLGPNQSGQCISRAECFPKKQGDRWHCTRTPQDGGPCQQGPGANGECAHPLLACQPVRTLAAKRRRWIVMCLALGVGLVFISLGSQSLWQTVFEPGQVSQVHQSIEDCGLCHAETNLGPSHWIKNAFFNTGAAHDNSERCIDCHDLGQHAYHAHALSSHTLETLTENKLATTTQQVNPRHLFRQFKPASAVGDKLLCETCHKEHQGINADITFLADKPCQSCHVEKYTAFSSDHPELLSYPYHTKTHIIFDHNSHFAKHFKEDDTPDRFNCADCHPLGASGKTMQTKSFENSCADCHQSDIRGSHRAEGKSILMFTLPGIDVDTLNLQGANIDGWSMETEEDITPLMWLLLESELPGVQDSLSDVDLLDLQDESSEVLETVSRLTNTIRKLFDDFETRGAIAFYERLQKPTTIDTEALARIEFMSMDTLRTMNNMWFNKGQSTTDRDSADVNIEDWMRYGGWYLEDYAVYYRPRHHQDTLIKEILTVLESLPRPLQQSVMDEFIGEDIAGACGYCHSVSEMPSGQVKVNWQAKTRLQQVKTFTKFLHQPHLLDVENMTCQTCHEYKANSGYLESFSFVSSEVKSNFEPMQKSACAECHMPGMASEGCLTCHNYHIHPNQY